MKMRSFFSRSFNLAITAATIVTVVSCGTRTNTGTTTGSGSMHSAVATLSGTVADTTVVGTARFDHLSGNNVKLTLNITVSKMANRSVAVHIHEHADCGNHANHAGGHWNPTNEAHGKWGTGSFHSGDIGNVSLDANGNGKVEITSTRWSIGGDAKTNVINRTIVIHSGVDDLKSQPAGNSGSRIGCGVIKGA